LIFEKKFSGVSFASKPNVGTTFSDCNFEGCNFLNGNMKNARLINCKFNCCDLSGLALNGVRISDCEFVGCKFLNVDFSQIDPLIVSFNIKESVLNECSFYGLNLSNHEFLNCEIKACDFSEANLFSAKFYNCDLESSVFHHTNLANADLTSAKRYCINPLNNKIKGAQVSFSESISILTELGLKVK
jgi:fluoroquinolone resistance protein